MKAIVCKFLGPTDTKGARYKATAYGSSITIGYDYEARTGADAARKAAEALCAKNGWKGELIEGTLPDGHSSVFLLKGSV